MFGDAEAYCYIVSSMVKQQVKPCNGKLITSSEQYPVTWCSTP